MQFPRGGGSHCQYAALPGNAGGVDRAFATRRPARPTSLRQQKNQACSSCPAPRANPPARLGRCEWTCFISYLSHRSTTVRQMDRLDMHAHACNGRHPSDSANQREITKNVLDSFHRKRPFCVSQAPDDAIKAAASPIDYLCAGASRSAGCRGGAHRAGDRAARCGWHN